MIIITFTSSFPSQPAPTFLFADYLSRTERSVSPLYLASHSGLHQRSSTEPDNFQPPEYRTRVPSTLSITSRGHIARIVPSRRELIAGVAGIVSVTAGCLSSEEGIARCSSQGVGSGSQHLREIAPIRGGEQIALGILVSEQAVSDERYHTVRIRDSDDFLVASIPLMSNRGMSSLDPEDYSIFGSSSGELYAVPLGQPPVHDEFTASLISSEDEQIATASLRFNCYAEDGTLP